jgi:hypothetical protein
MPRALPLLGLLLAGIAQAAGRPAECAAPALDTANLNLTAFLPNAPCLLAWNVTNWGQWGLWTGMATVGVILIATLFFWKLFQSMMSGTPEKALMPFVLAVVLIAFMGPAREGQGVIPDLQAQAMEGFVTLYAASARVGNQALSEGPGSVQERTRVLGTNIALMVARGSQASAIRKQMQAIKAGELAGDLKDPNLVNTLYAQQIEKENEGIGALFSGNDWIFNVGFLLLYTLFAIFAGIIFAIGFGMQLTLLLAPVALPFIIVGRWQPISMVGGTYFAALLTVAVLPIAVATVATVGLAIPAEVLTPTVTRMNSEVAADLTLYQANLDRGCSWAEVGCQVQQSLLLPILSDLSALKELFVQMLLMIMALLTGLTIAAAALRRVPAQISGMFGIPGGGESSGVETAALSKVMGGAAKMMGSQMLMKAAQQRLTGGLAGKIKSGGENKEGQSPTTGSSAAGAGDVPSPDVTAGAPNGGGGGDNVPPTDVTGTASGSSSGGPGAYASYRAARESGQGRLSSAAQGGQAAAASAGAGVKSYGAELAASEKEGWQRTKDRVSTSAWGGTENAQKVGRLQDAAKATTAQMQRDVQARAATRATSVPGPRNPDENELRPMVTDQEVQRQNVANIESRIVRPQPVQRQDGGRAGGPSPSAGTAVAAAPSPTRRSAATSGPPAVQDGSAFNASGVPNAPSAGAGAKPAPAPAPKKASWGGTGAPAPAPVPSGLSAETNRNQARAESDTRPPPNLTGVSNRNLYAATRAAPGVSTSPLTPSPAPAPAPAPVSAPSRNQIAAQRQGSNGGVSPARSSQNSEAAPRPTPAPAPAQPAEHVTNKVENDLKRQGK